MNSKRPALMNKVIKTCPTTKEKTEFWQKEFYIKHDVKKFWYQYVKSDTTKQIEIWEREPDRTLDLIPVNKDYELKKADQTCEYQLLRKDCIRFQRKHNEYIKVDINFVADFVYDTITDNILIGRFINYNHCF